MRQCPESSGVAPGSSMRLKTSLLSLAAATSLPILAFAFLAAFVAIRQENESLANAARLRNRATLAAVDADLHGTISTLRAIGDATELQRGDLRSFHQFAQGVLNTHASWINIALH